jgi:hypothetical protein
LDLFFRRFFRMPASPPPEIARSETIVFRKTDLAMSPPVVDLSTPQPERASDNSGAASDDSASSSPSGTSSGADAACEIESLREALQQALEDKAELIEESFLDKERIRDQKETIELLTKRVREFEMARSVNSSVRGSGGVKPGNSIPTLQSQIKLLSEDNIELAKEVDRLVTERDKLEQKIIDIKLKNVDKRRQTSIASTDEDEDGINVFTTYDGKRNSKKLGHNKKGGSVFAAAKNWFASKNRKGSAKNSASSSKVSFSPTRSVVV